MERDVKNFEDFRKWTLIPNEISLKKKEEEEKEEEKFQKFISTNIWTIERQRMSIYHHLLSTIFIPVRIKICNARIT